MFWYAKDLRLLAMLKASLEILVEVTAAATDERTGKPLRISLESSSHLNLCNIWRKLT
jgi:hypothetical protein